jgi:hypothetical protein
MDKRPPAAAAGDCMWGTQPASGDWNTATNWNPASVPTSTATFGASSRTGIVFSSSSNATVESIAFTADAPPYTFTFTTPDAAVPALTITGAGVSTDSPNPQRFVVASAAQDYEQVLLKFENSATAGGPGISYVSGPATPAAIGGGVIGFYDTSTAGSASFTITTGEGAPPKNNSTVGGEVSFCDSSSGGTARFTVFGSTSTANKGDTFGNAVFRDTATAANAVFTNAGGTLDGCDGGNTQFYVTASAGNGLFHNLGGTVPHANGGDVAFDGTATAANGNFHNYAATAAEGNGGVTSFNNNKPYMDPTAGSSAGSGFFYNYGAQASEQGGGHTYFTAKFGSPTAANGTFINYGSAVSGKDSCAGRTVFSISVPQAKGNFFPNAGNGTFWNFPGTGADAPGGLTEFAVYTDDSAASSGGKVPPAASGSAVPTVPSGSNIPTAANGTFVNLGALTKGPYGGLTSFSGPTTAGNALLLAMGGYNGGSGGRIAFYQGSSGGAATVGLYGNGTLDISDYQQPSLTIGNLQLGAGVIETTLGTVTMCLVVAGTLAMTTAPAAFSFKGGAGFALDTPYTILSAPNLSSFTAAQFTGNSVNGFTPSFSIVGNNLQVSFSQ